jgi:Bacterial Ig domain
MSRRLLLSLALLLVACQDKPAGLPPSVSIQSPSSGQTVSGQVTVEVQASADTGIQRVDLYLRPAGSSERGAVLGGASASPYQVGWSTFEQPSGTSLELVAEATDKGGTKGLSTPVPVQINNSGAPTLSYLAAISYPAIGGLGTATVHSGNIQSGRPEVHPAEVHFPANPQAASVLAPQAISPLSGSRTNDLEWGWNPLSGADGYGVYLARGSLAGPYVRQRNQAAGGVGQQGYAVSVSGEPGDRYFGAVSTITGSAESGLSNAAGATILPEPLLASPAEGQVIKGGRPTLTWTPAASAKGYLYYVYDKNPTGTNLKAVWTNYPNPAGASAAPYPSELTALGSGTYYWRVAAVGFDSARRANSFSFSAVRSLIVP